MEKQVARRSSFQSVEYRAATGFALLLLGTLPYDTIKLIRVASAFQEPQSGKDSMWPNSSNTEELLGNARLGNEGAEDQLLGLHREPLRRMIALRLDPALAGRLDASDVVQDVLVEAHRRLRDYLNHPTMPFHLWLRHIAQDHVIDAHRKHRQAQRRSLDREQPLHAAKSPDRSSVELAAQLLDHERTPASAAVQKELEQKLHCALEQLADDQREIILMRHFEQLSNQEVAVALNLSEAAASMRYLRAVRRLRELLVGE